MAQRKPQADRDYRPLQKWETAADEAIRAAQERGDFDNLPGHGKPLNLRDNPFAGDSALAFDMLENAGYAPYWIELDKEIRAETEALRSLREQTAQQIAALLNSGNDRPQECTPAPDTALQPRRWWPFRRRQSPPPVSETKPDYAAAASIRDRARHQYLERAAKLNDTIRNYNTYLPRDLWRMERLRPTPEQHAKTFDTVCPPITPKPTAD